MGKRKGDWQRFSKEVISSSEEEAKEKIYSLFGSKHRVSRTNIKFYEIKEISEEEIEDYLIKSKIEMEA